MKTLQWLLFIKEGEECRSLCKYKTQETILFRKHCPTFVFVSVILLFEHNLLKYELRLMICKKVSFGLHFYGQYGICCLPKYLYMISLSVSFKLDTDLTENYFFMNIWTLNIRHSIAPEKGCKLACPPGCHVSIGAAGANKYS